MNKQAKQQLVLFLIMLNLVITGTSQQIRQTYFLPQGNAGGFSPDGKTLLYEKKNKNSYYEIHTSDVNGANDGCVSCLNDSLPQKHAGCSSWSPDGKYILFVAEKKEHPGSSLDAVPGFGAYSDIFVMTSDGKRAWKLRDIPADPDHGVIAPRFSEDGKKMVWVERKKRPDIFAAKRFFGFWVIKVADFIDEENNPHLTNIKTYEPGGDAFYETYGFSPDGKKILFCSNMRSKHWYTSQLFTIDTETGENIIQLTQFDYNEHGMYTPDGKQIIWMTNSYGTGGTDWWMMNADGSMKQPLTYYCVKGNPMYYGKQVWTGTGFFNADATRFFGGVQTSLKKQEGFAVIFDFLPCGNGNGIMGEYYPDNTYKGTPKTRTDACFNFRYIPKQQDSLFTGKYYSCIWTAELEPLYSEEYTFYASNLKELMVYFDDVIVIDSKTKAMNGEKQFARSLEKGKRYKIKVMFRAKTGSNVKIYLAWKSKSQYKQIIPQSQLYH